MTEIEELLARAAIRRTQSRYNLSGDRGRIDELALCFTEDGVLDVEGGWTARGRDEIRAQTGGAADETRSRSSTGRMRHHLTTRGVEFDSDGEARAWTYFFVVTDVGPDHSGRYVDRLRKVGEDWLIAHRRVVVEWRSPQAIHSEGTPVGEAASDLEAIRQLKARYFRLMDEKRWDEWSDLFTEDARMEVADDVPQSPVIEGRKAIADRVPRVLEGVLSIHHGHMPEIELTGPRTARGTWAMEDYLESLSGDEFATVHGRGHYHEEYAKGDDGRWRIRRLQLTRLWLARDGEQQLSRAGADG